MPTLARNLRLWDEQHQWPGRGDEWSAPWGGTDTEWHGCIWPRIAQHLPAEHVLEIAPGRGRWTQFLQAYAAHLTVVDLAPTCIAACRDRFRGLTHLTYHVNDGRSLAMLDDASIDFVFSFDSLVHADTDTVRAYVLQLGHKLKVGGTGFLHHSNLGAQRHWLGAKRAVVALCAGSTRLADHLIQECLREPSMTAALMRDFCSEAGLACAMQELITWPGAHRPIDCLTTITKRPAITPCRVVVNRRFTEEAATLQRIAVLYANNVSPE
jgi:SAM-dependent methyltransferase